MSSKRKAPRKDTLGLPVVKSITPPSKQQYPLDRVFNSLFKQEISETETEEIYRISLTGENDQNQVFCCVSLSASNPGILSKLDWECRQILVHCCQILETQANENQKMAVSAEMILFSRFHRHNISQREKNICLKKIQAMSDIKIQLSYMYKESGKLFPVNSSSIWDLKPNEIYPEPVPLLPVSETGKAVMSQSGKIQPTFFFFQDLPQIWKGLKENKHITTVPLRVFSYLKDGEITPIRSDDRIGQKIADYILFSLLYRKPKTVKRNFSTIEELLYVENKKDRFKLKRKLVEFLDYLKNIQMIESYQMDKASITIFRIKDEDDNGEVSNTIPEASCE